MTVSQIMMRRFSALASVTTEDDLATVVDRLAQHGRGAVVVLDGSGALAGIITEGDVVTTLASHRAEFDRLRAADIMRRDVCTCHAEETELEIMKVMIERQIRHMAVMMGESVVGIVTLEEAVKQRLETIGRLTGAAMRQPDDAARLAMIDEHLRSNWTIFELFRAVNAVQEETGLAGLDARSRQIMWVIGEAEAAGKPLQLRDLLAGRRWGTYPTLRRHLDELYQAELVTVETGGATGKARRFVLAPLGRVAFDRMARAVTERLGVASH